jgi:hypothetical protein
LHKAQQRTENEFAEHALNRYAMTLAQKQFKAQVQQPDLTTDAIWDEHDFLCDNACAAPAGLSQLGPVCGVSQGIGIAPDTGQRV